MPPDARANTAVNAAPARQAGGLGRMSARLQPDFSHFDRAPPRIGRATTQTLDLLTTAMVVFGGVILVWAASAGVMRTAWLYDQQRLDFSHGFPPRGGGFDAWLFLLFQMLRGAGGVLAICCASGLVGALVGFVFGIPRPISGAESPPAAGGGMVPAGVSKGQAQKGWQLSTNLTQISDWLTKALVGVGLVEAKTFFTGFLHTSNDAAGWLFGMRHGSPILIPATMIGGAAFGFLFAYLFTQLIIARLLAATDSSLSITIRPETARMIQRIDASSEGLVPRISRSARAQEPLDQPRADEVSAAIELYHIPFEDLVADPGLSPGDLLSWARARAVLNDYAAAARAYLTLLGMAPSEE